MPKGAHLNLIVTFTVSVSLFGLLTTSIFALYPPTTLENYLWRKPLIGSIFTLICISGIIATFFPDKCSETFFSKKTEKPAISRAKNSNFDHGSITIRGHHPNCGRFSAHVIHKGEHALCAACTGLRLGAFAALAGAVLYFFVGWEFEQAVFSAVLVGQMGILLGFVQFKFKGYIRLVVNAFFVFASLLILVGVDSFAGNIFIDSYLIVLIVFWLFTRIVISRWDHWRICRECRLYCELKEG